MSRSRSSTLGALLFCAGAGSTLPVRAGAADRPQLLLKEPPRPGVRSPAARSGPEAELSRGKLAYERGDYAAAILALRPLLYPASVLSDEQQVELAHKLLGLSYFFERDEAGAEQEFTVLLTLRPDFALDPLVEPLKAVSFVDTLRRRNEERLAEVRRRQAEEDTRRKQEEEERRKQAEAASRKAAPRVYVERVEKRRFSAVSLVPFGVPQLLDRRLLVGSLLLSGEVLTGGASIATWLTVKVRYPDNTFPKNEFTTARALTVTYLTTGVAFWTLCIGGLIDALVHARTQVTYRELPGPPRELVKQGPKTSLRLLPLDGQLAGGAPPLGLSLGGSF